MDQFSSRDGWRATDQDSYASDVRVRRLEKDLALAREDLARAREAPAFVATVLSVSGERCLTVANGVVASHTAPRGTQVGQRVLVKGGGGGIVDVLPANMRVSVGDVVRVREVDVANGHAVVDLGSERRRVVLAHDALKTAVVGGRGILDPSGMVLLLALAPGGVEDMALGKTGVTWDDVKGLAAAKAALRDAIEGGTGASAELYRRYGRRAPRGILLYGPPGCGKTLLAKAAATATSGCGRLLYVKGPELLSPYVGSSEAAVRNLFANAKELADRGNGRIVVALDEADALLGTRVADTTFMRMERTIVPAFLAEMDGAHDSSGALLLLLTNRPDALDPAVLRDGRVDRKILVGRPTKTDAVEILTASFADCPGGAADDLAARAVSRIYDDDSVGVGVVARFSGPDVPDVVVSLRDVISAAMLVGVASRAKMSAFERDVAHGCEFSGIVTADVDGAVDALLAEERVVSHRDFLEEMLGRRATAGGVP